MTATRPPDARLASIVALSDFEPLARGVMAAEAFDYVAGGAWDEISLLENEAAWRRRRFRPRVLTDASGVDPSTTLLGTPAALPLAIAPMAAHGLAHADAELATVRAAAAVGVPFITSTMSTRSLEEVAAAAPRHTRWFQLYTQADPGRTRALVQRAQSAGYGAIILTVDLPRLGYRDRDRRSGFALDVTLGTSPRRSGPPTPTTAATDTSGWMSSAWPARPGTTWRPSEAGPPCRSCSRAS